MALKPITSLAIPSESLNPVLVAVNPKMKRADDGSESQATRKVEDRDVLVWSVDALVTSPNGPATLTVSVPADKVPEIPAFTPVRFENLTLGNWLSSDRAGQGGLFFQASMVRPQNSAPRKEGQPA